MAEFLHSNTPARQLKGVTNRTVILFYGSLICGPITAINSSGNCTFGVSKFPTERSSKPYEKITVVNFSYAPIK
jgi:hypothetical protein